MLRENNSYVYLLIFAFIYRRNITTQDIYIKVTSVNIYPNFWDIYIFLHVSPPCPLLAFRYKFYQNITCGAHFQFSNHDLFEKVVWKLLFENYLLFFIFYFTCCKFFVLKENHYSKQTKHVQDFPHGEIRMSH